MDEEKNIKADKTTILSLVKYFLFHLQTRSQQQHVELVNTFTAFCKCFRNTQKYSEKADAIKAKPIKFFIENNEGYFSKEELRHIDDEYRLPELDFLYFRDTSYNKKLKESYPTLTKSKNRYMKKLVLAQIIDILAYVRQTLFNDLVEVVADNGLELPMVLPKAEQHETGGVGIGARTQTPSF
jgi:hypothetical protein